MKVTEFIYSIIEKFAPIDPTERMKLEGQAMAMYKKNLESALKKQSANNEILADDSISEKEKPDLLEKFTIKEKIMLVLDSWYFKTILAMAFVFVVPKIQRYIQNYGRMADKDNFEDFEEYEDD